MYSQPLWLCVFELFGPCPKCLGQSRIYQEAGGKAERCCRSDPPCLGVAQWDSLNRALQGEPNWSLLGLIFFIFLTFFCRFMLFNICVAIITQFFTNVRKEVDEALELICERGWDKSEYARQRRLDKVTQKQTPTASPKRSHLWGVCRLSYTHPRAQIVSI